MKHTIRIEIGLLQMKLKEQQEQINMLIELVNNLVEREGDRQKYDKKIFPVIDLQKIVCQRLDYIEDFLDQNFSNEEDKKERIIN
jgi:hypothetical protein